MGVPKLTRYTAQVGNVVTGRSYCDVAPFWGTHRVERSMLLVRVLHGPAHPASPDAITATNTKPEVIDTDTIRTA